MEWAFVYLASLLDGEGMSSIAWQFNRGYIHPSPRVSIGLKRSEREIKLCYWLKDTFGGRVFGSSHGRNIIWQLADYERLKDVLPKTIPFMKLRREETELVLEAMKLLESDQRGLYMPFNKETLLKVAEISEKIKSFNPQKRGGKKWNLNTIRQYLEESPLYTAENRENIRLRLKQSWGKFGFKKGHKFPPEVREKARKKIIEATRAKSKYPQELVEHARKLYSEGRSVIELAKILNVNYYTLWDWLKRGRRV